MIPDLRHTVLEIYEHIKWHISWGKNHHFDCLIKPENTYEDLTSSYLNQFCNFIQIINSYSLEQAHSIRIIQTRNYPKRQPHHNAIKSTKTFPERDEHKVP